jgi:uncharacterized phage protein (TIGR02218 family)
MKVIPIALLQHYQSGCTTLCTIWTITLTNGTQHFFTDHDQDVIFSGQIYMSVVGYSPTAVDTSSELNPDNLELAGFMTSPSLTEADIHSGIWDYAKVEIAEINYLDPSMGKNILRTGTIGQVKGGRTKFTAELRGLMQAYTRTIVRETTKECTADLGDARCKVDLAAFTITVTVQTVDALNQSITSSGIPGPTSYWDGGLVSFTSGANAGLKMEVQFSTAGAISLHESMPFVIAPGDTFTMYPGCSKRLIEDCKNKFDNVINNRGFEYLPGSDAYKVGGSG